MINVYNGNHQPFVTPVMSTPHEKAAQSGQFLSLSEWSDERIARVLDDAHRLKQSGHRSREAEGKVLGLVFFNSSLRTRVSFETAVAHLGGSSSIIQPGQGTWTFEIEKGAVMDRDRTEHLQEAFQVLSGYCDAIGVRAFAGMQDWEADRSERLLQAVSEHVTVPLINMESAWSHPCQGMADWMTLQERFNGALQGRKLVLSWAPHPSPLPMAVPHTVLEVAARSDMDITLACPEGAEPDAAVLDRTRHLAEAGGRSFEVEHDQYRAFQDADVVYAKSWASPLIYSDPAEEQSLRQVNTHWQVTRKAMNRTRDAAFMHCLPVRRNVVVEDRVLDSPQAVHLQQAENRLHAQKAILRALWNVS